MSKNPNMDECGCYAVNGGIYGHARWCWLYIPPVPISDCCACGSTPGRQHYHTPQCKNRVWPEAPIDPIKETQKKLALIVEQLNNKK